MYLRLTIFYRARLRYNFFIDLLNEGMSFLLPTPPPPGAKKKEDMWVAFQNVIIDF